MRNQIGRTIGSLLVCALVVFLASVSLFAQGAPEGRLAGVVHDPTGAVIPGAAVVVTNNGTGTQYSATTGAEGGFVVPTLPAGVYTVKITVKGFTTGVYNEVKVDAAKEYSLTVTLKVGSTGETVEVSAGQDLVNTTSAEINNTLQSTQIMNLPLNGRGVIGFVGSQANVSTTNNKAGITVLSGSLPSWSQVTLEGINIQDIYIRTNALDFIPNRPSTEAVQEFTITQGAQDVNAALGANGVRMIFKSGTNAFHGGVYEFNRNSAIAANTWFNDHSGVKIPFLNRNEYGAKLGGPVMKNKVFFFGAYEALRNHSQAALNETIAAHDDLLQGVFRYVRPSDGSIQSVNVMQLVSGAGALGIDPVIQKSFIAKEPSASNVNNFNVGNSNSTRLLNTAGWLRNQASNTDRDVWNAKLDYEATTKHHFDFSFQHVHETTLRSDIDPFNLVPLVTNNNVSRFFSGGWRWTIKDNLINSFRTGSNYSQAPFDSSYKNTDGFLFNSGTSSTSTISGLGLTPQQVFFQPQGRIPTIHQYMDDLTWVRGNHTFTFGGNFQKQNVDSYDFGINPYLLPIYTTGFSASAPTNVQLTAGLFPGSSISSTDLAAANNLRAFLAGVVSTASQQFYVTSKTSGYVPGARNDRNLTLNDTMFYGQDKWHLLPNLTVSYGVKWEYLSPYKEVNGLQLSPVWKDPNNPASTLLDPNATIDFAKQLYNPDRHNFGPNVGFAWDPFKNGKTSIRGGYTLSFVNDDTFRAAGNASDGNAGLGSGVSLTGLYQRLGNGLPTVAAPTFKMPRTLADQLAVGTTSAMFGIDPNIHIPHIHEIAFSVQREIAKNMSVEVRYNGTLGRDLLRGVDLNQTNAGVNQAFLTDFLNARNNGYLSQAAGKGYNPAFNSAIAGSVPLTILGGTALGPNGGLLTNSTVIADLQQNQAAALADLYVQNRSLFPNAPTTFLPNPGIYAADLVKNGAFSSYHSGVVEVTRRYASGFQVQGNYTFAKLLSNSPQQTGQTRFDALLDNARPGYEKALSDYDLRQAFKMNAVYELPFGKGKMFVGNANGLVDRIIGGWQTSAIYTLQSGNRFSVLSQRGTFNRAGRSTIQTASSLLTQKNLQNLMNFQIASNGNVYWISPSATDPSTGRAVGPDNQTNAGSTSFNQVLFNPTAGNIGNLGLNAFTGPRYQNLDLRLAKNTKITERVNFQIGLDAFNAPNHPVFFIGNQEVNSTTFGRITSTNNSSRKLQISARLDF